ncbi:MAG: hypothetical protein ACKV2O_02060 [Acidimicrobiales bacterium]
MASTDPVKERRQQIARWVVLAKRSGWGLFGVAMALFIQGYITGYQEWGTTLIIVALSVGSIILAPAMVFGYGVKAADREERRAAALDPPVRG